MIVPHCNFTVFPEVGIAVNVMIAGAAASRVVGA